MTQLIRPACFAIGQVKAFMVDQKDQGGYSSSTLNLRVCGLKYYFRHVVHRLDLVVRVPNPRIQEYNTEVLTLEEVKLLRRCCRDMRQVLILSEFFEDGNLINQPF